VSAAGGASFTGPAIVASAITTPGVTYANTTFRDGIENTFTVGPVTVNGPYPLYTSWEDYSSGVTNILVSTSTDGWRARRAEAAKRRVPGCPGHREPELHRRPLALRRGQLLPSVRPRPRGPGARPPVI
jgi:hypothetical protein